MKVTPANCGATGPGSGELYEILKALVTTVNQLVVLANDLKAGAGTSTEDDAPATGLTV